MCICMHLFLVLALQANSFLFHIVCTRKIVSLPLPYQTPLPECCALRRLRKIVCPPPSVPPPQKKCGAMRRLCRVTSEGGMQARPAGREDHSNGWLLLSSYLSVGTTLSPLYAHTHTLVVLCHRPGPCRPAQHSS